MTSQRRSSRPRRGERGRSLLGLLVATLIVVGCSAGEGGNAERSEDPTSSASTDTGSTDESGEDADDDADPTTLRLGLAGVRTLDPLGASAASVSDVVLADLLFDTLTVVDGAGRVEPGLATFTADAERSTWRFELLADATFADGSAVTAQDVVFSLERLLSRGAGSLAAIQLEDVVAIQALGVDLVEISLRSPSALLPEQLASPLYGIVDREAIEALATGGDGTPNGSGEYATTILASDRLVLDRRRGAGPDRVELFLRPDESATADLLADGTVDWAPVPADRIGEDLGDAQASFTAFHGTVMLGVNASVMPLGNRGLRRAIALAIARGPLTDAVFGPAAQPLAGIVPDGVPGAADSCLEPCGPDRERAEILVRETFPDGQRVPLRLATDPSEIHAAIAGVLEEQLSAVGLDLETSALEVATFDQLVAAGQQQLFLFGTLGVSLTPSGHLASFASESPDNVTRYTNELVDAAIDAARAEPVATTRAARWREVEVAVLDDVAVVPLAQLRTIAATAPGIGDLVVRADGSIDLSAVSIPPR